MKRILVILGIIILSICSIIIYINRTKDISKKSIADGTEKEIIEERNEITFTRTYRIVKILEYEDNTNEFNYIVLDKFQEFNPYIIKIKKELSANLYEDCSYEFTFKGIYIKDFDYSNIRDLFNKFNIVNITLTNKSGLDQVQESPK